MKLHELSPAAGSNAPAWRKGRGAGSGNGKTAGILAFNNKVLAVFGVAISDDVKVDENTKKVSVIIGPEGGFTRDEALMLEQSGARVTTLGPRILRAETAPVAAVTAVMLQSGNM